MEVEGGFGVGVEVNSNGSVLVALVSSFAGLDSEWSCPTGENCNAKGREDNDSVAGEESDD